MVGQMLDFLVMQVYTAGDPSFMHSVFLIVSSCFHLLWHLLYRDKNKNTVLCTHSNPLTYFGYISVLIINCWYLKVPRCQN